MTIARQFYTIVAIPFFLGIGFALALTYQFAGLSSAGAALIDDWQRTATLNRQLAKANTEQSEQLRRQLDKIDPAFPEAARQLNYRLGETYSEYLKIDVDPRERMAVERVRSLQNELAVQSMHVYERLRAGDRAAAAERLHRVYQLEGQVRDESQRLDGMQMARLQAVMAHMTQTANRGLVALMVLVLALVIAIAASVYLVRRRVLAPIEGLVDASERMRRGDLAARLVVTRQDELGRLGTQFNVMAQALAESHADLEQRVQERTARIEQMQRQLGQAEKMSALGVLVGGVAHELNNPLAVIMGFTEMARAELRAAGGNTRSISLLHEVESQVDRCRRIVANLLQFARQQEPRLEVFAINDVVNQVIDLREYELRTRNTTVVRELDPSGPRLCADRDKIQRVLLNLLNNAQDAVGETGRPGRIWVRTRQVDDRISVEFVDEGPGFREPGRAFDPFYTTKDPGKGTGLGLSVCYGIVQEHHGQIDAGNWEHGARVTVSLPVGDVARAGAAAAVATAKPQPPARACEGLHALVVDDEDTLLRLHASFLARLGISSASASTGEEAVRYLAEHPADLVISDVRMPGAVDGVQLYEWVARHRPQLLSRFIFVSGDLVGLNLDEFFERTGAPAIMKPFRFDEYRRTVYEVVERTEVAR